MRHEAIAFARDRFDVKWLVGRVPEGLAKLVDRGIDVRVVVDLRVRGPQALPQFFARNYLTRFLHKCHQHLVDLALQLQPCAALKYFLALLIDVKWAEPNIAWGRLQEQAATPFVPVFQRR